jgi:predicted DNA-binding protein
MSEHEGTWETEDASVSRPVDAVVSVRFPRDLAERLFGEAQRRSVKTSAVVREAVEAFLSEDFGKPAAMDVTVSSTDAPITLYTGRGTQVRTESPTATLLETQEPG